ncbi:hypothetical protein FA13DRAFT_1711969 [Coprinellus micaceus]|uniref:Uncharacterized protein n=1 Tax=Coprinellus micaceus TaxID=71717 RepID=A0A4Y7T1Y1_COPMI|nr:hypothetical protein FA13DRAFT_1711969 [Coprinellus micaceus]
MLRFLTTGLELEEQQRALQKEVDELPKRPTAKQKADLRDKQNTLHRRILAWRETQRSFIPGIDELVADAQQDDEEHGIANAAGAETIPLMLPSALPPSTQALVNRIVGAESRLREAQAEDAILEICRVRRIITGLTTFKKYNFAGEGNKANTRVRSLYNRLQAKIQRARARYDHARECLMVLDPKGSWASHLLELKDEHIKGPGRDPDESHGKHQLTWIWLRRKNTQAPKVKTDVTAEEVDECERAEWCKARARVQRWREEVQLIKEEMRRVVVYLHWKAGWWEGQGIRRSDDIDVDVAHGLEAYSAKQASYCRRLAADCLTHWLPTLKKTNTDVGWAAKYQLSTGSIGNEEESEADSIEKESNNGEDEEVVARTAEEILLEIDG